MNLDALIQLDKDLLLLLNGSSSLFLDGMAVALTSAYTWIPLYISLFYIVMKNSDSMQRILLIVACAVLCVMLAGGMNEMVVKPMVERCRPMYDPQVGMLVDVVGNYRVTNYSFLSSHACNTFSIAVFISLLVRSRLLTVSLLLWSFTNCWTRMYLGVHFPFDILCGLLWGGAVGVIAYSVYKRCNKTFSISRHAKKTSRYTTGGFLKTDIDVVVMVLVLTLTYVVVRAMVCYDC